MRRQWLRAAMTVTGCVVYLLLAALAWAATLLYLLDWWLDGR